MRIVYILGSLLIVICDHCQGIRPRPSDVKKLKHHCIYHNVTYHTGHKFKPNPCTSCRCSRHLRRALCSVTDCVWNPNCLKFEKKKSVCCPKCLEHGCLHTDKKTYRLGSVISINKCEKCYCPQNGGRIVCERRKKCPRVPCADPRIPDGQCCPKCPNGATCRAFNEFIPAGAVVPINSYMCVCPKIQELLDGILDATCQKI